MRESRTVLNLKEAISALEEQRSVLGDTVVDSSIKALREKIANYLTQDRDLSKPLRRYVTVMFADISGFTSICSQNDAENVTTAINSLWDVLDSIIVNNGGFVDKHIGDCVMAVWGLGGVREDDSFRAVSAAIAMQDAIKSISLNGAGPIPSFSLRIGVHSGHVFITSIGLNKEYTVMGDTVNVASRIESHSPLGSVLVSYETWKQTKNDFVFQKQPPLKVKGLLEELDTYIVKGVASNPITLIGTSPFGLETPMVGREKELSILLEIQCKVHSDKATNMVTVLGEAGIGKSRLLHEFSLSIKQFKKETTFFNARCTPDMIDIPCAVFRDVLSLNFSVKANDSVDDLFLKFELGMKDVLSIQEIHLACNFAGFDMSSSNFIQRIEGDTSLAAAGRTALLKYFRITSEQGRTYMLLEDLHWADSTSLAFIEEIVREIPNQELLLICLSRLPLMERVPTWGEGLPNTFINLEPLSVLESNSLIALILQKIENLPVELVKLITVNSDGNPFYVEELIKMLVEDRVISTEDWSVNTEAFTKEKVPSTLTGVLQARLDALPASERKLLQMASVVGRAFWDKVIREISSDSSSEVIKLLSRAESHDLVHRINESTFFGANEYIFKHAILRDVTYETVLLKARKQYHKLVADWLENNSNERVDEFSSVIAYHYEKGESWQKALKWLIRSGSLAMSISAYKEALARFRRALEIPGKNLTVKQKAQLYFYCGSCLEKLCFYTEAVEELDKAVSISRKNEFFTILADSLLAHAWIAILTGRNAEVKPYAEEAFEVSKLADNPSVLAKSYMRIADFEEDRSYAKLISYYEKAFYIYKESTNEVGLAITLLNMGNIAMISERLDKAEKFYNESLVLYTKIGSRWGIANCLGNLGGVFSGRNEFDKGCEYFRQSLDVSRSIGDKEGEVLCNLNLGQAKTSTNNLDEAVKYLNKSLEVAISVSLIPLAIEALKCLAKAYMKLNRKEFAALILLCIDRESLSDPTRAEIDEMLEELVKLITVDRYQKIVKKAGRLTIVELSNQLLLDSFEC